MGETRGHYSKKYLVVSQTEPVNPADGLLWYKPDLCLTTTTTTLAPPDCPEGAIYSGWMTVGTDTGEGSYGYYTGVIGDMNPPLDVCEEIPISCIYWLDNKISLGTNLVINCDSVTVIIDGVSFNLTIAGQSPCGWEISGISENPFAPVGELSSICILCGAETTTTTTTEQI